MSPISKSERAIASRALDIRTLSDVDDLESLLAAEFGPLELRPVGDNPDNLGAIHASSDARLALNERYTNGIDAVLELEAFLRYGGDIAKMVADFSDPGEAARVLLGVPAGGPGAMNVSSRQKLAEKIEMNLQESGIATKPTCVIRDRGIGQSPAQIPNTILSIHRGNKRDKPFLMGVYGWGGSNALGFAEKTVIVSRRHPALLGVDADGVAVTIVKKIYEESMRTPAYMYLVGEGQNLLSLDPAAFDAEGFDHGSVIAHVNYELGINGPLFNQYNYFSTALFEPVVPVYLGSYRDADKAPGRRTIIGAGGRLKASADEDDLRGKTKVVYSRSAQVDLDPSQGYIGVNIWVLDKEGAVPTADIATNYVPADSSIVITLNGQRQEGEKREWIKRVCKLPHLYKRMVVQIEADGLTQETKVETFASTRERLRGSMREQMFAALQELIVGDDDLGTLEEHLREEALKHTAEKASDKDLEKLAKAIGRLGGRTREVEVDEEVDTGGGRRKREGGSSTPRDTSDDHLPETPTIFEFDRHSFTIEQDGPKRRVVLSINAKNRYLPDHDADLTIAVEGPQGETRDVYPNTRTDLLGGQATWYFGASSDATLGDYKVVASLRVGDVVLTDSIEVSVNERRNLDGKGKGAGKNKKTVKVKRQVPAGPQVHWIRKDAWEQHDFTATAVGRVDDSQDRVDIYLNLDFDKLADVLGNPRYTPAVVEARKSSYMVPTALGLYRIHQLEQDGDVSEERTVARLQQIVADSVLLATDPDGVLGLDDDDE